MTNSKADFSAQEKIFEMMTMTNEEKQLFSEFKPLSAFYKMGPDFEDYDLKTLPDETFKKMSYMHQFNLKPAPPEIWEDHLSDLMRIACQEKDLTYFHYFLHFYEDRLNKRIKGFLRKQNSDSNVPPGDIADIKSICYYVLQRLLLKYDPSMEASFDTFAFWFLKDVFRLVELERYMKPVPSLGTFKRLKRTAAKYSCEYGGFNKENELAVLDIQLEFNCSYETAERYLQTSLEFFGREDFYGRNKEEENYEENDYAAYNYYDEDNTADYEFSNVIDKSIDFNSDSAPALQTRPVWKAFRKLNRMEKDFVVSRLGICVNCWGSVTTSPYKTKFSSLAADYKMRENSAVRSYHNALDKMGDTLTDMGECLQVQIRRMKENSGSDAVTYYYRPTESEPNDNWGIITYFPDNNIHFICRLADKDFSSTKPYAKAVVEYLKNTPTCSLPNEKIVTFDKPFDWNDKHYDFGRRKPNLIPKEESA